MKKVSIFKDAITSSIVVASILSCGMFIALFFEGDRLTTPEQWASWAQAVGSVAAIVMSLGLVGYQNERQYRVERSREAANDLRITTFGKVFVLDAIATLRTLEEKQRYWPAGTNYVFRVRAKIEAMQTVTRSLAAQPLPLEMIEPVLSMHALIVSVLSSSEHLESLGPFTADIGLMNLWDKRSTAMTSIEKKITDASDSASVFASNAAQAIKHY